MNIKDAERLTGLKKANIRYYEEMGLLTPERNEQNNYREYGEREIRILERIKLLRLAGVPIQEIRKLQEGKSSVPEIMQKRRMELAAEMEHLRELEDLCRKLERQGTTFESLDPAVLDYGSLFFKKKGEVLMKTDRNRKYEQLMDLVRTLMCVAAALGVLVPFAGRVAGMHVPGWFVAFHLFVLAVLFVCFCIFRYKSVE
ncbi:hypothetical protein B5F07_09540 [Lachnoclostridium sp. An169]|uniref:MerR family transcriptional regulator n=1 Tax=Lachnoclostridium sp. An169 TaxID=1965569 RepID=UPI000B39B172|nr:MerR family transcriptional regulator [Lachnoclostridium sp. An169]OUP83803.1 hypothetical protein B5F07_09540 [Lachnoclostridium sp. An169]HJA67307.1 MerR family transcriptional regulator [Candidatus Mediterraneibacter cottocaccae]